MPLEKLQDITALSYAWLFCDAELFAEWLHVFWVTVLGVSVIGSHDFRSQKLARLQVRKRDFGLVYDSQNYEAIMFHLSTPCRFLRRSSRNMSLSRLPNAIELRGRMCSPSCKTTCRHRCPTLLPLQLVTACEVWLCQRSLLLCPCLICSFCACRYLLYRLPMSLLYQRRILCIQNLPMQKGGPKTWAHKRGPKTTAPKTGIETSARTQSVGVKKGDDSKHGLPTES